MNCAVVDIESSGSSNKRSVSGGHKENKADKTDVAQVAQAALSSLPDLYVANLAGINHCRTQETKDPVFDNPGKDVQYANGAKPAGLSIRAGKGQCTGVGHNSADSAPPSSLISSSNPVGADGQLNGGADNQKPIAYNNGKWHPVGYDGSKGPKTGKNQALEVQKDAVLLEKEEETTEEQTEESAEDIEVVADEEEPEEVKPKKHSISGYRTKKPKYYRDDDDDDSENYDDDYSLDLEDYGLYRQFKTREAPSEETAISTPDPNAEAYEAFFNDDNDIIPGVEVISDESTTFMVIQEPSTVLTIQAPTASAIPYYDEKGYLIIDTPAGLPDPDNFIIPVSAGRIPFASVSQSVAAVAETTGAPLGDLGGLQGFTWPTASASRPQKSAAAIDHEEVVSSVELSATNIITVAASVSTTTPVVNINILVSTTTAQQEPTGKLEDGEDDEYDDEELLEILEEIAPLQVDEQDVIVDTFQTPNIHELPVLTEEPTISSIEEAGQEDLTAGDIPISVADLLDTTSLPNEDSELLPRPMLPNEVQDLDVPVIPGVGGGLITPVRTEDTQTQPALCARAKIIPEYVSGEPTEHSSAHIRRRGAPPSGCDELTWNCDGCRAPNRCVRIDRCTRSCTLLPYLGLDRMEMHKRQYEDYEGPESYTEFYNLEEGGDGIDAASEDFFFEEGQDWYPYVEEPGASIEEIYTFPGGEKKKTKKRQIDFPSLVDPVRDLIAAEKAAAAVEEGPLDELCEYLSGPIVESEQGAIAESSPVYSWPTPDNFLADLPAAFEGEEEGEVVTLTNESSQIAEAGDGVDEGDLLALRRRQDPNPEYTDILEGGDGIDVDAEAIFGEQPDPLLVGLESPYEDEEEQVEEEPVTSEIGQSDDTTTTGVEEIISDVADELEAPESVEEEVEPVALVKTPVHRRQDPDFEYADISEGGDGIDADPEAIFGKPYDSILDGLDSPLLEEEEMSEEPNTTVSAPTPEAGSEVVEQPVVLPNNDASASSPPKVQSEGKDMDLRPENNLEEAFTYEPVRLRKRQDEYEESFAGEGTDFDPIAVFGQDIGELSCFVHEKISLLMISCAVGVIDQIEGEEIVEAAETDLENTPTQTSEEPLSHETIFDVTSLDEVPINKRQLVPPMNSASLVSLDAPQAIDWASVNPIVVPPGTYTGDPSYEGDGVDPDAESMFPNLAPGVSGKDWSGEGDEIYEEVEAFWEEPASTSTIGASTASVQTKTLGSATSVQTATLESTASVQVVVQAFATSVQTTTVSPTSVEAPATVVAFSTTTSVVVATLINGSTSQTSSLVASATATTTQPAILPAQAEEETEEDADAEEEEYFDEGDDGEWEWEWEYEDESKEDSTLTAANVYNQASTNGSSFASASASASTSSTIPSAPLYPLNGTWNSTTSTSTLATTSTPTIGDITKSILPFILGPGPVIPPSVSVDWPAPPSLSSAEVPVGVAVVSSETTATPTSSVPVVPTVAVIPVVEPLAPVVSATTSEVVAPIVSAIVGSVEPPPRIWLGRHMRRAMLNL